MGQPHTEQSVVQVRLIREKRVFSPPQPACHHMKRIDYWQGKNGGHNYWFYWLIQSPSMGQANR
ncbi:hypothetical protein GF1_21170 [Desulfolithobacter dissulfuricans]|uniref:Uncharacterized protein n=1 Tax=Desulfolithobacter dissulfuricans TaxID=2795293 RepID=A0A915UA94_9BACT|nr:hypothetical protein GF1_21170 [Desulfolithobacter dissulfuricans]